MGLCQSSQLIFYTYLTAGTLVQCQGRMRRIFFCQKEKEEYFLSGIALQSKEIMYYVLGKNKTNKIVLYLLSETRF